MLRLLLMMMMLSLSIVTVSSRAAPAFEATYRLPCIILYHDKAPITTNCLANITTSGRSWVEIVKTGNGKSFSIEEDDGTGHFYLDHEPCDKVSDEPNPCYQNWKVKLCL